MEIARSVGQESVRFSPSWVAGAPDVHEVAVYPDRVELHGERGTATIRFADVAVGAEKRSLFNRSPRLGRVAGIHYSREKYADSHVRLLTHPPVTVYMPTDGPTQMPDSHFWRLQQVIRSGGYDVYDLDDPPKSHLADQLPSWLQALVYTCLTIGFLNFTVFWVVAVAIGGDAVNGKTEGGRYYVMNHGRYTEVSREIWTYSKWHARSTWLTHALMFAAVLSAIAYAKAHPKSPEHTPADPIRPSGKS